VRSDRENGFPHEDSGVSYQAPEFTGALKGLDYGHFGVAVGAVFVMLRRREYYAVLGQKAQNRHGMSSAKC
jgi:hypothetical protein